MLEGLSETSIAPAACRVLPGAGALISPVDVMVSGYLFCLHSLGRTVFNSRHSTQLRNPNFFLPKRGRNFSNYKKTFLLLAKKTCNPDEVEAD
jgi:hypothetical protein